ncbi:MAG: hypothetical protein RJA07_1283 [Bacteroidota bacterium]|jgi:hypothetical protein
MNQKPIPIIQVAVAIVAFSIVSMLSCTSNISPANTTTQQDSANKKLQLQDSLDAEAMHDLAPAIGILPK